MKRRELLIGGYVGFTVLYVGRELWKTQREQMEEARQQADEEYGEGNWHWECSNVCRTVPKDDTTFTFSIRRGLYPPEPFEFPLTVEFQTYHKDTWRANVSVSVSEWGERFEVELDRSQIYRIVVFPSRGDARSVGRFNPEREDSENQITIST